jgi:PPK2 family polyphosphate:nucleotide phosphotransferase
MIILKKDISENFIVNPGIEIKLSNWDPIFTGGISKSYAENLLENDFMNQMSNLQYKLFADKSQALLVVLQGMDASGKDGTIRHAMKALNPQSCKVFSFKKPTDEEISHDYLWKIHRYMPAKGEIAIFNRSHYEAVIEERVHKLVSENTWSKRYDQINEFEQYLFENNIQIVKVFLYISKDEQKKRLEKRINDPTKQWKFSESDIIARKLWDDYIIAYEEVLRKCSTKHIPWYIIPSNNKWYRNFVIAQIIINTLENMDLKFPKPKIDLSKIFMFD